VAPQGSKRFAGTKMFHVEQRLSALVDVSRETPNLNRYNPAIHPHFVNE
jgi:hypothetical protein